MCHFRDLERGQKWRNTISESRSITRFISTTRRFLCWISDPSHALVCSVVLKYAISSLFLTYRLFKNCTGWHQDFSLKLMDVLGYSKQICKAGQWHAEMSGKPGVISSEMLSVIRKDSEEL